MEQNAAKLGAAAAAAVLAFGLPALASAQTDPSDTSVDNTLTTAPDVLDESMAPLMPVGDAIASAGDVAQRLSTMDPLSADQVVVVSLNDLGATAEQRYTLMQDVDPSAEASLQQALTTAQVLETGSLGGYQRSLAQHLQTMGVDPATVVAASIDNDDGTVTVYTQ